MHLMLLLLLQMLLHKLMMLRWNFCEGASRLFVFDHSCGSINARHHSSRMSDRRMISIDAWYTSGQPIIVLVTA